MNAATADATTTAAPEAIFQALADSTRLRCLALIVNHGELCVCELVHALELSQPKISRHLKLLREAGLVADRRERIWVHYRLSDTLPLWARRTLGDVVAAHAHDAPFAGDARRLAHMPDRPEGRCDS